METLTALRDRLSDYPAAETLIGLALLAAAAVLADFLVRQVLLAALRRAAEATGVDGRTAGLRPAARTLARIVPALVVYEGIIAVPHLDAAVHAVTRNVASAFIVIVVAMGFSALLTLAGAAHAGRARAGARSIKGYIELVKILVYAVAVILAVAALIERSPLLLLSGLGALAAVLMLVFRDTLLSLVASVLLNAHDMLRLGDWIEMPQLHADGEVIDIALHTVKVQNWDKTITTIPTYRLINESFKNWRGMRESGGRRIKRALLIDQTSVRFLTSEECERLRRFALIDDYLVRKTEEIEVWNAALAEAGRDAVNMRRQTNLGAFRAYVESYLRNHGRVRPDMTLLARQLQPTAGGLPLEVYGFTDTVAWADYETIQADIFDHLIAILPEFGLRLFQQPSGIDMARWAGGGEGDAAAPTKKRADGDRPRA